MGLFPDQRQFTEIDGYPTWSRRRPTKLKKKTRTKSNRPSFLRLVVHALVGSFPAPKLKRPNLKPSTQSQPARKSNPRNTSTQTNGSFDVIKRNGATDDKRSKTSTISTWLEEIETPNSHSTSSTGSKSQTGSTKSSRDKNDHPTHRKTDGRQGSESSVRKTNSKAPRRERSIRAKEEPDERGSKVRSHVKRTTTAIHEEGGH
ncbi:hypothetical protein QBC38DRAFT_451136 [Podospora fimiseda]|uniref:Uncharacterized protein n=1 Tax=Podospora fimiseda TaxID=252190 RepID=A0AAN7BXX2_9PEZI|nr:hypothetical protein QBC38DRAFT_451136 [Podospora fimiseda]